MASFDAVVAGHICLDIIPEIPFTEVQAYLTPGALGEIGRAVLATGGSVSNTGRALHRLGIPTRLMGKIGDDPFGRIVSELVNQDDPALAETMRVAAGEITSYTLVISPPGIDRSFLHCPGANHTFGADDIDYSRLDGARVFHFGYPPLMKRIFADDGAQLVELFRRVKAMGLLTSLDMSMPDPNGPSGRVNWRHLLERVLPYVDFFLPSLDEMLYMLCYEHRIPPAVAVSQVSGDLLAMGAGLVGLKIGDKGFYVRTGTQDVPALVGGGWHERELWAPCFRPEPLIGTTGAGDTTIAGFIAAILHGQAIEDAMTSAVAVGACNVEAADALGGVRPWDVTQTRIQAGWVRSPLAVDAPGWHWDAARALWSGPNDRG